VVLHEASNYISPNSEMDCPQAFLSVDSTVEQMLSMNWYTFSDCKTAENSVQPVLALCL